jgi:hypothetical protein
MERSSSVAAGMPASHGLAGLVVSPGKDDGKWH